MDGEGTLILGLGFADNLPPIRGHASAFGRFASVSLTDTGGDKREFAGAACR